MPERLSGNFALPFRSVFVACDEALELANDLAAGSAAEALPE